MKFPANEIGMSIGGANRGSAPLDWANDDRAINKLKINALFFLISFLSRVDPTDGTECTASLQTKVREGCAHEGEQGMRQQTRVDEWLAGIVLDVWLATHAFCAQTADGGVRRTGHFHVVNASCPCESAKHRGEWFACLASHAMHGPVLSDGAMPINTLSCKLQTHQL
ncbi:MAG: hypothetical protein KA791_12385 [Flavobacteriales bacterium]|nr:hypothetical protein [Flavobacteriales bacterium]